MFIWISAKNILLNYISIKKMTSSVNNSFKKHYCVKKTSFQTRNDVIKKIKYKNGFMINSINEIK